MSLRKLLLQSSFDVLIFSPKKKKRKNKKGCVCENLGIQMRFQATFECSSAVYYSGQSPRISFSESAAFVVLWLALFRFGCAHVVASSCSSTLLPLNLTRSAKCQLPTVFGSLLLNQFFSRHLFPFI